MKRELCVCLEFLEPKHRAMIEKAARETGFTAEFFSPEDEALPAALSRCEVFYGHSPKQLRHCSAALRWYACSYAGIDAYCRDESLFANPDCLLTNANVYGLTIAEHTIMVLLMLLRRMPEYEELVEAKRWEHDLPIRSIYGSSFTLLGTGEIGTLIAQRLRAMGAEKVLGLNRSGKPHPAFDQVFPIAELDRLLPETESLILALPETAETVGLLSRERIAALPQGALVVNVGRGSAIDQGALVEALNHGHLGGAALDVAQVEPPAPEDPLWTAKNLVLTPHAAGNMTLSHTRQRNVELFCENLRRYASGQPLSGQIDRRRGY